MIRNRMRMCVALFVGVMTIGVRLDAAPKVSSDASITDHADQTMLGSLMNALSQIAVDTCAVVELPGNHVYGLGQNLTIPANVDLKFQPGAVLSVSKGVTLSINGGIEAGLRQIFTGEGIVDGIPKIIEVYPQWFGAKGDGKADDTRALQDAIDFACRTGIKAVNLNRGKYRVTKTINCTNTRRPGTIDRDGLRIYGMAGIVCGSGRTVIVGETGAGHAIIEISGIQGGEFENFSLFSGKNNPSTVGLFMGIPKLLPQCQNNVIHIRIGMHDDMSANDGLGTIGLWNFAAEENTYHSVYFTANRPVILSAFNGFPNPSGPLNLNYKYSYVEQLKVHSLGVTAFSGECFLRARGGGPVITTQCANSVQLGSTYIGAFNKGTAAIEMYGSLENLNYFGTVEGVGTFLVNNGKIKNSTISALFGGTYDKDAPIIRMGNKSKILNTTIKFSFETAKERHLFALDVQAGKEAKETEQNDLDTLIKEGAVAGEVAPDAGLRTEATGSTALVNSEIFTTLEDKYLNVPNSLMVNSRNSCIYNPNRRIELK